MSDENLRELERRFKETGSVDDEAAWLRERIRVGGLMRERLELAAYCGHQASQIALQRAPREHFISQPLERWALGFKAWGKEACVVVCVAAAELVLPLWEELDRELHDDWEAGKIALKAATAWLRTKAPGQAESAYRAAEIAWDAWPASHEDDATATARAAFAAARQDQAYPDQTPPMTPGAGWSYAEDAAAAVTAVAERFGEESTRAAVSEAVVCWALGGS